MKSKNHYILIVILFLALVSIVIVSRFSASDSKVIVDEQPLEEPKQEERSIIQYIPILKDYQWIYSVQGDPERAVIVSVDFLKQNVVQLSFKSSDKNIIKVYTFEEDGFYEVATLENVDYKVDYTTTRQYKKPLLKLPLDENSVWYLNSSEYAAIQNIDYAHTSVLGTNSAIEVIYRLEDKVVTAYFGDKKGLLELKVIEGSDTLTLQLQNIETKSISTQMIDVAYIKSSDKSLVYSPQEVTIRTNEEPIHFLTDILKMVPSEDYIPTLPSTAAINSIYYDFEECIIYIDLNEEYVQNPGFKNYQEASDLSLINTIGNYYNANFINITIEGSLYAPTYLSSVEGKGIEVQEKSNNPSS